jgi:alpha-N-arabinofuranosidase
MKKIISVFLVLGLFASLLNAQSIGKFHNPILAGFYPDPSICKVGDDYYIVNSTFEYFPGIPIFHSKDLTSWVQIGSVLDRPDQIKLDGLGSSRGIFAPAIRYHNGIFYVTCTLVDGGGNFIVTAKNPAGPWSDPVWLPEVNGIDPSLFFDDDDQAYLTYNADAPDNKPLYPGHRTIRIYKFDIKNLKVIGENKILINGGVDFSKKPIWIEGPHIYKINGTYYLTAAEGGTAEDHSQVILKSETVDGPYFPYEKNPILTQRDLDPKRKNPVTCTGHADFVQAPNGDWWAIFLGCRPYEPFEENHYNTGRETFLAPVKWVDGPAGKGWPVINPDFKEVQFSYPYPAAPVGKVDFPLNGNFTYRDNFNEDKLQLHWLMLRNPKEKWYDLSERKGFLKMNLRPEIVQDNVNPSFLAHRQQHQRGYASVAMNFNAADSNEKAGIIAYKDGRFYYLCKSVENGNCVVQLYKSSDEKDVKDMQLIASEKIGNDNSDKNIQLKIKADGKYYSFYYALKDDEWLPVKENVDAKYLSTKSIWGFVGTSFAMYATSSGMPSNNNAYFDWFEYSGDDETFE